MDQRGKIFKMPAHLVIVVLAHFRYHYLLMMRRNRMFFLVEQFLIKFLTRTQTRFYDLYVLLRLKTRK